MNIFAKAAQGLNLTPAQRAFLKLLKLWFYTALSAGVMTGAQYLLNNGQVNWQALIYISGGSFLLSILGALDKYFTSQGDAPLALLTEAGIQRVQQLAPPTPQPLPAQPAPVANFSQAQRQPEPIVLQPRQQSIAPAVPNMTTNINPQMPAVPQIPFPSSPNTTGSASATNTISFGDTGIVPTIK